MFTQRLPVSNARSRVWLEKLQARSLQHSCESKAAAALADAEIQYGALGLGCGLFTQTATTTFNFSAAVPAACTVAANNLNFGTAGVLAANTDASSV